MISISANRHSGPLRYGVRLTERDHFGSALFVVAGECHEATERSMQHFMETGARLFNLAGLQREGRDGRQSCICVRRRLVKVASIVTLRVGSLIEKQNMTRVTGVLLANQ